MKFDAAHLTHYDQGHQSTIELHKPFIFLTRTENFHIYFSTVELFFFDNYHYQYVKLYNQHL